MNTPGLLLHRCPLTTIGHLLLPLSWTHSEVSRVWKPLAPACTLLGRYHCGQSCCSQWATVSTRRLRGSQSRLGITGDVGLGKRKAGQGRSGNLSSIESWLRNDIVCRHRGECPRRLSVSLYSPLRGGPHPQAGGNRVMSCISSAVAL